jgi:hypothetical protein
MDEYKAVLSYPSQSTPHHFTLHPKSDKPVKAIIGHLSMNISSEDTTLALQNVDSDVISAKKNWQQNASRMRAQ